MHDMLADKDGHCGEWDASSLGKCIGLLESYFLIRITEGPEHSIHPLVHAWARLGNIASTEELGGKHSSSASILESCEHS